MDAQTPFDVMITNILSKLESSGKVEEVGNHFISDIDTKEMFKYLWNMEYTHQYMYVKLLDRGKNDKIGETFRLQGNDYYKKKDLKKALEFYNKSILHSPNFNCSSIGNENENVKPESKNLALAYSNRSAVLFELKYYENCLLDIKRSYDHGFPSLTRFKLIEREAKCYLALQKIKKAKNVLKEGIDFVKKLNLSEDKIATICKPLKDIIKECNTDKECVNNSLEVSNKVKLFFDVPEPPIILNKNNQIPSLIDAVSLMYAPEKGRYIIANRDIMPGELLVSEKCFSHVVLPASLGCHCSYCFCRTHIPLPCPNCSLVLFCSELCLSKGLEVFHNKECLILPSLIAMELGKNPMLALRTILQMSLQELKAKVSSYLSNDNVDPLSLGFNEKNLYLSENYKTVFNLVTNKDERTVGDLFKRCSQAVCLIKLLLKTNYFGHPYSNLGEIEPHIVEDIYLVGFILILHAMSLPSNAHSIAELAVNLESSQQSVMEEIGAGVFSTLSLFNHSCNPSISRSCYGSYAVAHALSFIPKGSEVMDCYSEHYSMNTKSDRQKEISKQYYFDCYCEACSNNWCMYSDLKNEIFVKCTDCSEPIPLDGKICSKCKKSTSKMKALSRTSTDNLDLLFKNIKRYKNLFHIDYKRVLGGVVSDQIIDNLLDLIFYLSKHTVLPNKLLFEAQETLKHCYDIKALQYDFL